MFVSVSSGIKRGMSLYVAYCSSQNVLSSNSSTQNVSTDYTFLYQHLCGNKFVVKLLQPVCSHWNTQRNLTKNLHWPFKEGHSLNLYVFSVLVRYSEWFLGQTFVPFLRTRQFHVFQLSWMSLWQFSAVLVLAPLAASYHKNSCARWKLLRFEKHSSFSASHL